MANDRRAFPFNDTNEDLVLRADLGGSQGDALFWPVVEEDPAVGEERTVLYHQPASGAAIRAFPYIEDVQLGGSLEERLLARTLGQSAACVRSFQGSFPPVWTARLSDWSGPGPGGFDVSGLNGDWVLNFAGGETWRATIPGTAHQIVLERAAYTVASLDYGWFVRLPFQSALPSTDMHLQIRWTDRLLYGGVIPDPSGYPFSVRAHAGGWTPGTFQLTGPAGHPCTGVGRGGCGPLKNNYTVRISGCGICSPVLPNGGSITGADFGPANRDYVCRYSGNGWYSEPSPEFPLPPVISADPLIPDTNPGVGRSEIHIVTSAVSEVTEVELRVHGTWTSSGPQRFASWRYFWHTIQSTFFPVCGPLSGPLIAIPYHPSTGESIPWPDACAVPSGEVLA